MQIFTERDMHSVPANPENFTGRVWRTDFITRGEGAELSGIRFVYEPGARSFWHVHEREQAIIAVAGSGLVAWDGLETPQSLEPGDWWHVVPGVPHWHGAKPNTMFAHIAVTAGGGTNWLHEVSDADYVSLHDNAGGHGGRFR